MCTVCTGRGLGVDLDWAWTGRALGVDWAWTGRVLYVLCVLCALCVLCVLCVGVDRVVQETEQSGRRGCDLSALKSRASGSVSDQPSVDVAKNKGSNRTKATQRTWADIVKGSQTEKREKGTSNDSFELSSFSRNNPVRRTKV